LEGKVFKRFAKWWTITLGALVITGIVYLVASAAPVPYRIITEYPMGILVEELGQMHECAECHETEDFHTCETCHNEHGSAILAGLNLYSLVHLTGDVPITKFISTNQFFLEEKQKIGQVTVNDFLIQHGVDDFASITFASNDGGFTTVFRDQLSDTSFLLPYEDGVRFADENLHVSTWIKGINKIIVVGNQKVITVGGVAYSIGELMMMDTVRFTVEQAQVMLKSEQDGNIRSGFTAERLEGIELNGILRFSANDVFRVDSIEGESIEKIGEELDGAKLVQIGTEIVLVFPEKSRNQWIFGVSAITEVEQ
jgi:hypothetical protein